MQAQATSPAEVEKHLKALLAKHDIVIADGPGGLDKQNVVLIKHADLCVIPVMASPLDVHSAYAGAKQLVTAISKRHRRKCAVRFVINGLDNRTGVSKSIRGFAKRMDPPAAKHAVRRLTDIVKAYRNFRRDGRSLVEIDQENAEKVRKVFNLYAYGGHTLDSLVDKLDADGVWYTRKTRRFVRAKLHTILRDRSYIGEVAYHGEWYPGTHTPIIDRPTFDRVQTLLGSQVYQSHELVYAGDLIKCGHCGNAVTGEVKTKKTRRGPKEYRYYRCARYNKPGHPRVRLKEADLDGQVLAMFDRIRIESDDIRDWFARVLHARTRADQKASQERVAELNRQVTMVRNQQDQLLNLRLMDEIDEQTFARKGRELRDRLSELTLQLEACDRSRAEHAEIAVKAFELSQTLRDKWLSADYRAKHQLLEIVCLNFSLDGVTLVPELRKPFDVLAEGLVSEKSRVFRNQLELFVQGIEQMDPGVRHLVLAA